MTGIKNAAGEWRRYFVDHGEVCADTVGYRCCSVRKMSAEPEGFVALRSQDIS